MKITVFKLLYLILIIFSLYNTSPICAQKNIYISQANYKEIGFRSHLSTNAIGFLYNGDKKIQFGAELSSYKFWDDNYSSIGLGIWPIVQICFYKQNKHKIYLQTKGGPIYMFPEFPKDALNYTVSVSPCYEIAIFENHKLRFGIAYLHYSNGKIYEQNKNRCWDGLGINSGWIFN